MSVIESQAMDMTAMVPPVGAVPVGIARVYEQAIEGSVTYTGTVQAFVDEDIYPRITGRITAMPVYPGDQVKRGQLLVQLDPLESEYKAKRDEAFYAEDAAKHNAGIAKTEFAQKKYELQAAEKAEEAAKKAIEEANANLNYWTPEVAREKVLYEKAVISLDEYQRELSLCEAARARVQQAEAKLQEATNTKLAAQAALDEMIHHIGHQYALSKQAKATLANASIYQNYTTIVAQDDAVVTKRIISPNVVVNPGMLLLKLAHVKQVRIQAEVASDDVEKIRLGNTVYIKTSQGSKDELTAQVTSIFPAADPTSRTFTVESLIDNLVDSKSIGSQKQNQIGAVRQYRYLPGQYVVMRIETGRHRGLVIPTSAVVWREGKAQVWKAVSSGKSRSAKVEYTCTMHPEVISDKPGKCPKCGMDLVPKNVGGRQVAYLADITIGLSNPDKTEVLTGLKEGDEVIFAGYANLQPGMPVVATEWGSQGPKELPLASEVAGNRLNASNNWKQEEMRDHLMVETSLSPAKSSANSIIVKLSKHGGGAVVGSRVNIKTSMPGMNMTGPTLSGITGANGEAVMRSNLSSGLWQLQISIGVPGQAAVESTLDVEVP